jgi:dipeptidyl aminopeptidase/acylaminoacyl peptidase
MRGCILSRLTVWALTFLALAGASGAEPEEVQREVQEVEVIPRREFFGNPDRASVQISPDGTQISYVAPLDGVLNVWVAPRGEVSRARAVTADRGRGIRVYFWAYTSRHIIYLQDRNGDENWRAYSVDLRTGNEVDLTPLEGVQARIQGVSRYFPEEILVGLNDRNPQLHDLYRINIVTGAREKVVENYEGFFGYVTDDRYQVRFALRLTADGGNEVLKRAEDGKWEPYLQIPQEDVLTTSPVDFDESGEVLYMIDSRGRDTAALKTVNLKTGEEVTIGEDSRADVDGVLIHPVRKTIEAYATTYELREWRLVDRSLAEDFAYLKGVMSGAWEIVSRSDDDQWWIVADIRDDSPVRYYLYDRKKKEAEFLFTNRSNLKNKPLAKMRHTTISSRDGLNLVVYYTLPVWSDRDGDKKPHQPLPTVLWVHGGPWFRDTWGYNAVHQWLANRGYAVISVNFRGSTGFGKKFLNAANREWGGKMHDDLIDTVEWAIREGIADPKKIAIGGGSYGGYATLVGMTLTPAVFACGVDLVGPSNLITFMNAIPPYWKPLMDLFITRVGDHRTEEGRKFLMERSPLTYVDRIKRPLLIGQGANDPRVNQKESDQIVEAMQEKGIPVTYALYPDEGHGFARPENSLSFFALADVFLGNCLGGRTEPIGDDLRGASLQVPVGASEIAGLEEALHALSLDSGSGQTQ